MKKNSIQISFLICLTLLFTACNFHLQGEMQLAAPLHRMYLQSCEPYGPLSRYLEQYLKMSKVCLVSTPDQANTILVILKDINTQVLLSVSSTQQTRQYNLITTVEFEVTDSEGRVLICPQILRESRTITIQSNQILGTSNEANLFYQQMHRAIAYALMNRLASQEVTQILMPIRPLR